MFCLVGLLAVFKVFSTRPFSFLWEGEMTKGALVTKRGQNFFQEVHTLLP